MRYAGLLCGAAASLLVAAAADAATITFVPDRVGIGPNQTIQIFVSGGEQVFGLDLFLQINDGGPAIGGDDAAPVITNVNLVTGTIFATNNTGQTDLSNTPLAYAGGITTSTGTVAANGLLATITVDTTGLPHAGFELRTKGVAGQYDTQLTDNFGGTISLTQPDVVVFPEPGILAGLAIPSASLLFRPRRRLAKAEQ